MNFIGDVHGKFNQYPTLKGASIQVGDMGIGFGNNPKTIQPYFIHGNHDNPDESKQYPTYLGRYGYITISGLKIFFISGAYSIDKQQRTIGVDWWENEELSYLEMIGMLDLYNGADIIVSHDCPASVYPQIGIKNAKYSITANALETLLQHENKPSRWIFGHHHQSHQIFHKGVEFKCLAELEVFTL